MELLFSLSAHFPNSFSVKEMNERIPIDMGLEEEDAADEEEKRIAVREDEDDPTSPAEDEEEEEEEEDVAEGVSQLVGFGTNVNWEEFHAISSGDMHSRLLLLLFCDH